MTHAASAEMNLALDGAGLSVARLKFLRLVFGPVNEAACSVGKVVSLFLAQQSGEGVNVRATYPDAEISGAQVKLLALLLMTAKSGLKRGGEISIGSNDSNWILRAVPARMIEDYDSILSDPSSVKAKDLHIAVAMATAKEYGRELSMTIAGETLIISA